jgi:hypothetical protein
MAFRDRQWYVNAIERAKLNVEQIRGALELYLANADHSLAMLKCEELKSALQSLVELEYRLAEKGA